MKLEINSKVDENKAYYSFKLNCLDNLDDVYWDMKLCRNINIDVYFRENPNDCYSSQMTYLNDPDAWIKTMKDINNILYDIVDKKKLLYLLADNKYSGVSRVKKLFVKRLKYFDEPLEIIQDKLAFEELLNFFKKQESNETKKT